MHLLCFFLSTLDSLHLFIVTILHELIVKTALAFFEKPSDLLLDLPDSFSVQISLIFSFEGEIALFDRIRETQV